MLWELGMAMKIYKPWRLMKTSKVKDDDNGWPTLLWDPCLRGDDIRKMGMTILKYDGKSGFEDDFQETFEELVEIGLGETFVF